MFRKISAFLSLLFVLATLAACAIPTPAPLQGAAASPAAVASPAAAAVEATPEEDEPGWNCEIHGNAECGPSGSAADVPELWPPVDNQHDALVQCFYYLQPGLAQDDCVSSAFQAFRIDPRSILA